jgi:phage protein D
MAERAGSVLWKLSLGGKEIDIKDIVQFTVDKDLNQPDMAVAVLRNTSHQYVSQAKIGDPFEIKSTLPGTNALKLLFTGDISGIEPQYKGGGESRVTVRAFCTLHKKLQGKKSKTFQDKTDQQIITDVLGQIEWKGPQENPTYKHITQDNMTDLDFARLRASRIGCYIWSENGKIMVKVPELDKDSGVEFKVYDKQEGDHRIKSFAPRLTGAQIVKELEVRGWNPETKKAIVEKVKAEKSSLGDVEASAAADTKAAPMQYMCDQPIWSNEEAKCLAKAKLQEHNLGYMSAEAEAFGNPDYLPGKVIKIFINSQAKDKFDGKYFVTGTTHKYAHGTQTTPDGGYTTIFRLARNAEVG